MCKSYVYVIGHDKYIFEMVAQDVIISQNLQNLAKLGEWLIISLRF